MPRTFKKYPSKFVTVKIFDDNFDDVEVWGDYPYSVEDFLYDVTHEIDGDYTILDDSNELGTTGTKFTGYVIARVSNSILDFMDRTDIDYAVVDEDLVTASTRAKKPSRSVKASKAKTVTKKLRAEIYDYLDTMEGYGDYDDKIDLVMEEFGLSKDQAESEVWNWSIDWQG